jgi:cell division septation protein DedD
LVKNKITHNNKKQNNKQNKQKKKPKPKPTATITTNKNNNITCSGFLLYLWLSALFSHHQRGCLLQQLGTDAETHSQTL